MVNFIKSRPLHTRLFRVLYDEMGAEHNGLLFHSNIRWISRGKVMERVANLRNEISIFLEQKHRFFDRFSDRGRRLKGIYSRSDTNRTGAEGLSFYCPRLLHCLNQMLAVMSSSQHRVSSSKTVRPRAPCGARCIGMLLVHGLRFALRRHTRNSVKERHPICAWTNGIAQHQSAGG